MDKFRPILEKTLGQDEAGKFIQNTRNSDNFYRWAAKSLMQNYPDAVATLSETDQKAFRSNVKKIKALNIAFQFQKTLAVNVNQELIRNFMADHNNPKKALDNIFSALNQQAEKEIQKTTQKKNQTKELDSAGGNELNVVKMESK